MTRMTVRTGLVWVLGVSPLLLTTAGTLAQSSTVETGTRVDATTNVFNDSSEEGDLAARPFLDLEHGFGSLWSAGYTGQVSGYVVHPQLNHGWHQVRLTANPTWGDQQQHEVFTQFTAETLRSGPDYAALNVLKPEVLISMTLEPTPWLSASTFARAEWRWFYDDEPSTSLDGWAGVSATLTSPTRTTLTSRLRAGVRLFPYQDLSVTRDVADAQVEAGVHASQGLWPMAGLQADLSWRQALGRNGLLTRKLTQEQFTYLGEDFLYSGGRAELGIKQVLDPGWTLFAGVGAESRTWAGWPIADPVGPRPPPTRRDLRVYPHLSILRTWIPGEDLPPGVPQISLEGEHTIVRQWSNSSWFDTTIHLSTLTLTLTW